MKQTIELYVSRLYLGPGIFWFTLFEIVNFSNNKSWSLLQFGRTSAGWNLEFSSNNEP